MNGTGKEAKNVKACGKGYRYCDACEALRLDDENKWTCSAGKEATLNGVREKNVANGGGQRAPSQIEVKERSEGRERK